MSLGNDSEREALVRAAARVLYMVDGADFDLIVSERADGPTATLVARLIVGAIERARTTALPGERACERCGGCGWVADGPELPQYDCPDCTAQPGQEPSA